jgi:hypothetical protein
MSEQFGSYNDDETFTVDLQITGEGFVLGAHAAGVFPTPGYVISIVYGNQGINPDPSIAMLYVHETALAGAWPQALTTISASAGFDLEHNPAQVQFHLPGGETFTRSLE